MMPEQRIALKDGHGKHGVERLDTFRPIVVGVGLDVGNVDSSAFKRSAGGRAIRNGTKRMVLNPLH
jgi:hypothetical protein